MIGSLKSPDPERIAHLELPPFITSSKRVGQRDLMRLESLISVSSLERETSRRQKRRTCT